MSHPDIRYLVTTKKGIDTLHMNPGEQCNLDDSDNDQEIDEFTAEALLQRGDARRCQHCLELG